MPDSAGGCFRVSQVDGVRSVTDGGAAAGNTKQNKQDRKDRHKAFAAGLLPGCLLVS